MFLISRSDAPTLLHPVVKLFNVVSMIVEVGLKQIGPRRFRRGGMFAQPPRKLVIVLISVAS